MKLQAIGEINTPYKTVEDCPFFSSFTNDEAKLKIYKDFELGLKALDEVSHIIVIYWLHKANREELLISNPHDNELRGVFAMRSQHRPNTLGVSIVKILDIEENIITVDGLDCLNGTTLIDIKPYDASSEAINEARIKYWEKNK